MDLLTPGGKHDQRLLSYTSTPASNARAGLRGLGLKQGPMVMVRMRRLHTTHGADSQFTMEPISTVDRESFTR